VLLFKLGGDRSGNASIFKFLRNNKFAKIIIIVITKKAIEFFQTKSKTFLLANKNPIINFFYKINFFQLRFLFKFNINKKTCLPYILKHPLE